ncbi:RNA polymerase sigma factor [Occultella glacieicola]|uniref:RNA polymerase sigma factor n=1 Tax=Occultella glacieicola TaxID=2518684 RepID=A0ABY2E694_9MICO|nr:RNA polymerase sigma factor [Occultella glacieicola]
MRAEAILQDVLTTSARDLLRYCEYRLGPDEAEDVLSEVLVAAWRRADDLPDNGHDARLWLFGIARNTVLNARRSGRRRSNLGHQLRRHHDGTDARAADAGLDVRDAVDRLEPDLAELIRTVHWDGFTVAEAARVLDIPSSTATSRYQRARTMLRRSLAPDGDAPGPAETEHRRDRAATPADRVPDRPRLRTVGSGQEVAPAR